MITLQLELLALILVKGSRVYSKNTGGEAGIHLGWDSSPLQDTIHSHLWVIYIASPDTSMFLELGEKMWTQRKPRQSWEEHAKVHTGSKQTKMEPGTLELWGCTTISLGVFVIIFLSQSQTSFSTCECQECDLSWNSAKIIHHKPSFTVVHSVMLDTRELLVKRTCSMLLLQGLSKTFFSQANEGQNKLISFLMISNHAPTTCHTMHLLVQKLAHVASKSCQTACFLMWEI